MCTFFGFTSRLSACVTLKGSSVMIQTTGQMHNQQPSALAKHAACAIWYDKLFHLGLSRRDPTYCYLNPAYNYTS